MWWTNFKILCNWKRKKIVIRATSLSASGRCDLDRTRGAPGQDLTRQGLDRTRGYPPPSWTDRQQWKYYPPVVLRIRAVIICNLCVNYEIIRVCSRWPLALWILFNCLYFTDSLPMYAITLRGWTLIKCVTVVKLNTASSKLASDTNLILDKCRKVTLYEMKVNFARPRSSQPQAWICDCQW